MMSFVNVSLKETVWNQYCFKLKSFYGMFRSIIILQVIAIGFTSLAGVASTGSGSMTISFNVQYYSADAVIAFTMIGLFINGIQMTTKPFREDDFVFVTNRLSQNLSNMAFLLTVSVATGITALLSRNVIEMIRYFLPEHSYMQDMDGPNTWYMVVGGGIATILYIAACSALGYLVGSLVQLYKGLVIIIPAVVIGYSVILGTQEGYIMGKIWAFYFSEHHLGLFAVKLICTIAICYGAAILLLNQKEVRNV
ncbi:hypothetical protein DX933_16790 [Ornithinibacillus gellani]|nr:hypothetical protein DX933_16790 [Ornithinibacillus gellani]